MGDSRTVPAASAAELPELATDGQPASQAETIHSSFCPHCGISTSWVDGHYHLPSCPLYLPGAPVGIDVPGVGVIHDSPYADSVALGVARMHRTARAELRTADEERSRLMCALLFASRRALQDTVSSIEIAIGDGATERIYTCRECKRSVYGLGPIKHAGACRAGAVRQILDDLMALPAPAVPAHAEGQQAQREESGEFGEPWTVAVEPVFGRVALYDAAGTLMVATDAWDQDAIKRAWRVRDCVNSCATGAQEDADSVSVAGGTELCCRKCGEWNGAGWTSETFPWTPTLSGFCAANQVLVSDHLPAIYRVYTHACKAASDQAVAQ